MPLGREQDSGVLTAGPGVPRGPCRPCTEKGAAEPQSGLPWACSCPLETFAWRPYLWTLTPPRYKSLRTHELPLMDSTHGPVHTHSHQTCALGPGQPGTPHHWTQVALHAGASTPQKGDCAPELSPGCSCFHSPASPRAQPRRALLADPRENVFMATPSRPPSQLPLRQSRAEQTPAQMTQVRAVRLHARGAVGQGLTGLPFGPLCPGSPRSPLLPGSPCKRSVAP